MTNAPAAIRWNEEITALLDELSAIQQELFDCLAAKRRCLASDDWSTMQPLQEREEQLAARLEDFQKRRADLLALARKQRLPAESLGKLAMAVGGGEREKLSSRVNSLGAEMRLLRHESLTNWVLAQRSLLHVSQLIEIIATGGRLQPTYGDGESPFARGALVNDEA